MTVESRPNLKPIEGECHVLYFALDTIRSLHEELKSAGYMHFVAEADRFNGAGRELDSGYCRKYPVLFYGSLRNPRLEIPITGIKSFWENIRAFSLKVEALRLRSIHFTTPFFRWENATPHKFGRQMLLFNAVNPLLSEDGQFKKPMNASFIAKNLQCKVDGESLVFNAKSCPEITDEARQSLDGHGPVIDNATFEQEQKCARKVLLDGSGKKHVLYFFSGQHTIHPSEENLPIKEVHAVQVLLNYETFKKHPVLYQELVQNYSGFLRVEGKELMSAQNNVALLDYTHFSTRYIPRSHGLYSILHPKNARGFEVYVHLPVGYDHSLEAVRFEKSAHKVECRL